MSAGFGSVANGRNTNRSDVGVKSYSEFAVGLHFDNSNVVTVQSNWRIRLQDVEQCDFRINLSFLTFPVLRMDHNIIHLKAVLMKISFH